MRLVLHGSLKKLWPEPFEVKADTVWEAIQAFQSQTRVFHDLPVDQRPVIRVIDFETDQKLQAPTEVDEVHLVPAMFGGGKIGQIVIGAALIAASFFVQDPFLKSVLLSTGIGMVIGGAMAFFVKAPSVDQSNDPPASKYLGLGTNTTAIGTPIAYAAGRIKVAGHYLSVQINATDMVFGTFPETP